MARRTPNINPSRPSRSERSGRPDRRGFTLAESLIASVVLAMAVVAVGGSLSAAYQQSQTVDRSARCLAYARDLIEEILARPYVDPNSGATSQGPDPLTEPNRNFFDNIGDYNGYLATFNPGDGFRYTVGAAVAYRSTPGGVAAPTGDFALVTVTTSVPGAPSVTLCRLVSRFKTT